MEREPSRAQKREGKEQGGGLHAGPIYHIPPSSGSARLFVHVHVVDATQLRLNVARLACDGDGDGDGEMNSVQIQRCLLLWCTVTLNGKRTCYQTVRIRGSRHEEMDHVRCPVHLTGGAQCIKMKWLIPLFASDGRVVVSNRS